MRQSCDMQVSGLDPIVMGFHPFHANTQETEQATNGTDIIIYTAGFNEALCKWLRLI